MTLTSESSSETTDPARLPSRRFWQRRALVSKEPQVTDALRRAIDLEHWSYNHFFPRPTNRDWDRCIPTIESLISSIVWRDLPFFELAYEDNEALKLWTSQEIVVTNAFSQIVLAAASTIQNVHLRTVLTTVAQGEHGWVDTEGHATDSHPWLLHLLRESLNIPAGRIEPKEATKEFISFMIDSVADPLTAVAVIAVGNERLLIPEYEQIEACFRKLLRDARFEPFLHANLTEDQIHYRLCYDAASQMIALGGASARRKFEETAIASINARLLYLERLADCHLSETTS